MVEPSRSNRLGLLVVALAAVGLLGLLLTACLLPSSTRSPQVQAPDPTAVVSTTNVSAPSVPALAPDGPRSSNLPPRIEAPANLTAAGEGLLRIFPLGTHVPCVAVTPDGRWAAICDRSRRLQVYELATGTLYWELGWNTTANSDAERVAISADGQRVVCTTTIAAYSGSDIHVWDLRKPSEIPPESKLPPTGDRSTPHTMTRRLGVPILTKEHPHWRVTHRVNSLVLSPDGRKLLSAGVGPTGNVWLWDVDRAQGELVFRYPNGIGEVGRAVFLPGDRVLFGGGVFSPREHLQDCELKVWNLNDKKLECSLPGHRLAITSVAASLDGAYAVSGGYDKTVRLWDLTQRREIWAILLPDVVSAVAISRDAQRVCAATRGGEIRVWNFQGAQACRAIHSLCSSLALPDDARLLLSSGEQDARLWRLSDDVNGTKTLPAADAALDPLR